MFFIVDYVYVIWSIFFYVINCFYNGLLLKFYFLVFWCLVFLFLWLLLIYLKYDKFFFILYFLSLKLDLIFFFLLVRKISICWWKVIDLFVFGSVVIYFSCLLVLNWVFLNVFLFCIFREGKNILLLYLNWFFFFEVCI